MIRISGEEVLPGGKVVKREFMLVFRFWDLNEGNLIGGANPSGLGGAGTALPLPSAPLAPPKATSLGEGKGSSSSSSGKW